MSFNFDQPVTRKGTGSEKWDLPGEPEDFIPLWVADMDFESPPGVVEALKKRAAHGVYGYTMVGEDLFAAFAAWQKKRNGLALERDWLIQTQGVVPSLYYAVEAFTREGDGVVVQPPVYPPIFQAVETLGRKLVCNPLKEDAAARTYRMDLEHLEAVLDKGAKLLLLCSPHNPVGRVWTERELRDLAELCLAKGVMIVSDEIHSDLILPGAKFVSLFGLGERIAGNVLACSAPSKTFNIPGTGCALVAAPDPGRREAFRKAAARAAAFSNSNLFSTTASLAAYSSGEAWLDSLLSYLAGNYAFLKEFLAAEQPSVKVYALEGTYVPWCDFRAFGLDGKALRALLREAGVKLSDGPFFGPGGEGFERVNIACPRSTLEEGLGRIAKAFGRKGFR